MACEAFESWLTSIDRTFLLLSCLVRTPPPKKKKPSPPPQIFLWSSLLCRVNFWSQLCSSRMSSAWKKVIVWMFRDVTWLVWAWILGQVCMVVVSKTKCPSTSYRQLDWSQFLSWIFRKINFCPLLNSWYSPRELVRKDVWQIAMLQFCFYLWILTSAHLIWCASVISHYTSTLFFP